MNIVILEPIGISLEECQKQLPDHHITEVDSRQWTDEQVIEAAKDAEIIMITNRLLPAKIIENLPLLKLISVAFTGIDQIDASIVRERKITVKNASGYAKTAVAELVIGFMIALARNIVTNAHNINHGAVTNSGTELKGKVLGIIGLGAIGNEVARLADAFGMEVLSHNRGSGTPLNEIFAQSDYVSIHVPLVEETRGLVNLQRLKQMKPSAFVINTARGPIIDGAALRQALEEGIIAGAAVDVFDVEPPLPENYALLGSPHLIATPHLGFNTKEAVKQKGRIALENILDFLKQTT
jgi:phosphoglycerate dehydrogenase-like enzyme